MEVGELISFFRKQSGMTIDELAAKSGVPKGTLNKIIGGVTKAPTLDNMKSIAKALGKTLADFDDNPTETKNSPSTAEAAPGEELEREVIRLAGNLSDEQKDFFLALLRLTAARNQGLSAADLVSAGEAALKAGHHNPTQ